MSYPTIVQWGYFGIGLLTGVLSSMSILFFASIYQAYKWAIKSLGGGA